MLKRILLVIVVLKCAAGSLAAQQRRPIAAGEESGWTGELGSDVALGLRLAVPPELALFERRPFSDWVQEWTAAVRLRLAAAERRLLRQPVGARGEPEPVAVAAAPPPDTVEYLPPLAVKADTVAGVLPGVVGQYANLGMEVRGRGELGGQWNQYKPCDPALPQSCDPGLFPQLKPDVLFGVAIGGTISERIHVNVDYDQAREFDAANNINVYYQGLTDEVLQRVEVGDVSIRLPTSRFLTRGIPAGNFGFMASGQLGPMDFQTVFAQQRGDVTSKEFALGGGGQQQGLVQEAQLVLDDADYVDGQFFFLVEPQRLAGSPHIDVLALTAAAAPEAFRPAAGGTIQLYRDERLSPTSVQQSAQLGYFLANATPPGGGAQHSGTFKRLVPEQDYYVHSSGLWIMLRSPLRIDEALAVSYVTESGDTIGTFDAEQAPAGVTPELRLLRGPATTHQPGTSTWPLELHQVYRLDSSSDVEPSDIELVVTLGEAAGGTRFRVIDGQQVSFLRLFGLDEDAPADRADLAQIFQPGRYASGDGTQQAIGGTFLVFPTLQPFLEPPPSPSAGVSAEQARQALGGDANAAIYEDQDPVRRQTSTRFRLTFKYRVAVQGVVSSFNLGAFGIREGSERLRLGSQELRRDVDYTIDYDIGQVQLLDAQTLFGANPGAQLRASWEQKPLFQIAPTSVFGLNTRFRLAQRGELNFVGLYQVEKTLMSRPQLGTEPGSIFLGGTSGRLDLGGALLERALNALPGLRLNGASNVRLTGELAFSTPNPNTRGAAYVDDFESSDELRIEPRRQLWKLGSRPGTSQGDRGTLPMVLDASTAVPLIWQQEYSVAGRTVGPFLPSEIDQQINVAGTELREPVMFLTFGWPDSVAPPIPPAEQRQWRSITQVISTTGADLSRSEYLEFYVSSDSAFEATPLSLIFDLGVVGEDAFYVDPEGQTSGTYQEDGRQWGLGVPDEEARLALREVWGRELDARGLWDQPCTGDPTTVYRLGDPVANCTRSNGVRDSEDLNGDGIVSTADEQYFRYVVQLGDASEYLVREAGRRDSTGTGTRFRLYRIPLRAGNVTAVNATEGSWRFVRHLRLTVAGSMAEQGQIRLALARMRIVGSRWTKRDLTGVVHGLLEGESGLGASGTQVRVGPVSQLTEGLKYRRPPFVEDETQDPQSSIGASGVEYNEKSLRIAYDDLEPGDRAEAYFHYAQQPRNFLAYRQLRLWALARRGTWGRPDGERLLVKLGTDPKNYYLYQTRLKEATGDRTALSSDWLPELVIDFQPWLALRAEAERRIVARGEQSSVQDTVWSADSTYALVYENRARAPNLAAIRELSFAVYNGGLASSSGEVWIDDLRLGSAERKAGTAASFGVDVAAGDFLTASVSYAKQGDVFRQLNEEPTYLASGDLTVAADARLDRFLPASWGLELPLTVTHSSTSQTPTFLSQSDVSATQLDGLRETGTGATRVGLRLRKTTPTAQPLLSLLVDGTQVRVGWSRAHASAITSKQESSGLDASVTYRRDLDARTVAAMPGFVAAALRALTPAAVENSSAFQRLVGSRLRWTPAALGFSSGYGNQLSRSYLYDRILDLPGDTAVRPIESPRKALRNEATLVLQPFRELDLSFTLQSDRDLLEAAKAAPGLREQAALERERGGVAGLDLGWETSRSLLTSFGYRPVIADWLRLTYTRENRFATGRDPSYLEYRAEGADTVAFLQRRFDADRRTTARVQLRPAELVRGWFGLPDSTAGGFGAFLRRQVAKVQPLELVWTRGLSSLFERERLMPSTGYQLGFGDLEAFRFMAGDTAARAQQRRDFRANTGITLFRDAVLSFSYRENGTLSFDARGGRREAHERAWPGGSIALRSLPLGAFFPTASVSLGAERVRRESVIGSPSGTGQERGSTSLDLVPRLSLGIGKGRAPILVSYDGRFSIGDSFEPTGRAEDFTGAHNVMITTVFQLPEGIRGGLDQPLNVTLSLAQNNQRRCRVLESAQTQSCTAYVDFGTRTGSLRFDTTLDDLRIGTSIDYTSRDTYVGLRNGTNQFQLMLFGEFNFKAGSLPAGFGGLR